MGRTKVIGELDEIHLSVKDLAKMRRFYTQVLGFDEKFYHEGRMLGLDTGGAMLVLEAAEHPASGVALTFTCSEIERVLERIAKKGVRITVPLEEGHWGAKLAGCEDPEGNLIYLEESVPERLRHEH